LKALFLCLLIAGSAVGYVWQKSQVYQLGQQIRQREIRLKQMRDVNQKLADQLAMLRSPSQLEKSAPEFGLGPARPSQIWRLSEPTLAGSENPDASRSLAVRRTGATTQ